MFLDNKTPGTRVLRFSNWEAWVLSHLGFTSCLHGMDVGLLSTENPMTSSANPRAQELGWVLSAVIKAFSGKECVHCWSWLRVIPHAGLMWQNQTRVSGGSWVVRMIWELGGLGRQVWSCRLWGYISASVLTSAGTIFLTCISFWRSLQGQGQGSTYNVPDIGSYPV